MRSLKRSAQSLIEYGLILALVAVVAVTVLSKFGGTIQGVGDKTNESVNQVSSNAMENYCKSINKTYSNGICN